MNTILEIEPEESCPMCSEEITEISRNGDIVEFYNQNVCTFVCDKNTIIISHGEP